jgi:hypothetical protein
VAAEDICRSNIPGCQLIIEKNVSFAAACAVIGGIQTYQHRDLIGIAAF